MALGKKVTTKVEPRKAFDYETEAPEAREIGTAVYRRVQGFQCSGCARILETGQFKDHCPPPCGRKIVYASFPYKK